MEKLGTLARTALAIVLFAVCMSVVAIRTLGMSTLVVTGSSMEPAIGKGDLVIVEPVAPSLVRLGDIVTFERKGQMTTHRVVAIDTADPSSPVFTTKGDANIVADPEPIRFAGNVGRYRASIPLLGYVIVYGQAYARTALTLVAAAVFFASAGLLLFRRERRPARALAPVAVIDPDDLWRTHIGWLRERHAVGVRAA